MCKCYIFIDKVYRSTEHWIFIDSKCCIEHCIFWYGISFCKSVIFLLIVYVVLSIVFLLIWYIVMLKCYIFIDSICCTELYIFIDKAYRFAKVYDIKGCISLIWCQYILTYFQLFRASGCRNTRATRGSFEKQETVETNYFA